MPKSSCKYLPFVLICCTCHSSKNFLILKFKYLCWEKIGIRIRGIKIWIWNCGFGFLIIHEKNGGFRIRIVIPGLIFVSLNQLICWQKLQGRQIVIIFHKKCAKTCNCSGQSRVLSLEHKYPPPPSHFDFSFFLSF